MADFPPIGGNATVQDDDVAGGVSHLDYLRTRHAAITADRFLDLTVPGYEGHLVVRYGVVPWKAVAKAVDLMQTPGRDGEGLLLAQVDFLVAACREILFRDEAGELTPVNPSGEPVRFEADLATLLQFEATTARETLRYVFGNDLAIAVQAGEVLSWSQSSGDEGTDTFMGESGPAVR